MESSDGKNQAVLASRVLKENLGEPDGASRRCDCGSDGVILRLQEKLRETKKKSEEYLSHRKQELEAQAAILKIKEEKILELEEHLALISLEIRDDESICSISSNASTQTQVGVLGDKTKLGDFEPVKKQPKLFGPWLELYMTAEQELPPVPSTSPIASSSRGISDKYSHLKRGNYLPSTVSDAMTVADGTLIHKVPQTQEKRASHTDTGRRLQQRCVARIEPLREEAKDQAWKRGYRKRPLE